MSTESPLLNLSSRFAALGDATRLSIVETLLREGEKSAGDLVSRASISAPAGSRHLKVLTDSGLLLRRVDRQRRLYSINSDGFGDVAAWMQEHADFWDESLNRLQAAVEAKQEDQRHG